MEPAVCEPSVSEPMEPAVCEPSVSEPMEPAVCEPSVSEPMEPAVCEPSVSEPMEPAVCEPSVSEPMEPAVWKMPISEPAVFETLASEPARYELPVFEPTAEVDEKQLSAMKQAATVDETAILAFLHEMGLAVAALETMVDVGQSSLGVELEEYDEELEKWKSEVKANGRKTTMEVVDALVTMVNDQKQSVMDANVNVKQSVMDANVNVKQSVMDANVDGKQSVMDADVETEVKQSAMDAVARVKPKNSWDTKRKNLQRMQKRKLRDEGN